MVDLSHEKISSLRVWASDRSNIKNYLADFHLLCKVLQFSQVFQVLYKIKKYFEIILK